MGPFGWRHFWPLSKLNKKGLDMIAANLVGKPGLGFGSEENELLVLSGDERNYITRSAKPKVARSLLALIADKYLEYNN